MVSMKMARPVHFEIHGEDPVKAGEFYAQVFGWSFDRWGSHDYWLHGTGEGLGIDGASAPPQEHGQKVVLTIEVDDLEEAIERTRLAGGTVLVERSAIPGIGWLAQVLDPNDVVFGILQSDESAG